MDTNTHNNTEYHTPQQPHRGMEVWGRLESGGALVLAATEPQVIRQRRAWVTNGGRSPVRTWRLGLIWFPGQTALVKNGAERRRRRRKGQKGKNHCGH